MEWSDRALVISNRAHGERDCLLEVFTRDRGRQMGLVRGGRSARRAAVLQTGNSLQVTWRARLDEHLGHFAVEPVTDRAAMLMSGRASLALAQTLAAELHLFAERDPHPDLHDAAILLLDHAGDGRAAIAGLVRFELMLLAALGFGMDLSVCALTGATEDLAFVSPKTGRAASRAAALPYAPRLLRLPAFLVGGAAEDVTAEDVADGLKLTAHFLRRDVWEPRRLDPPLPRETLERIVD
jgi:DNA repair protein RecO (recombination protein O)